MSKGDPYAKAVAHFVALLKETTQTATRSPLELGKKIGLPAASAYRLVSVLERHGFLERDPASYLVRGPSSLRVGLKASGVSGHSDLLRPVLRDLRAQTRSTTFIGLLRANTVDIGAYSLSRGLGYIRPLGGSYSVERHFENEHEYLLRIKHQTERQCAFVIYSPILPVGDDGDFVLGVLADGPMEALRHRKYVADCAGRLAGVFGAGRSKSESDD